MLENTMYIKYKQINEYINWKLSDTFSNILHNYSSYIYTCTY